MTISFAHSFRRAFRADGGGNYPGPTSDFWYSPYALGGITPDRALGYPAVYSCVRVCAETLASYPLIVYQRLADGGKRRAKEHPLYKLLGSRPNEWQTSFEWIEMQQGHLDLRGNAYNYIKPGLNGAIDQLVPLHPDRVVVWRIPGTNTIQYKVGSAATGRIYTYNQDEIFHIRGWSSNGITGLSPIAVQFEMIHKGLGTQKYASKYFENSATPSGVIKHPDAMEQTAYDRLKVSFHEATTAENRHRAIILEEGAEWQPIGISNKDSQMLEAMAATDVQVCGMYRVPPHKVGILTQSTNNNIEHQGIEFVTDCMMPRAERWEARIQADLIDPLNLNDGNEYFAEFLMDASLRGDLLSRYQAYQIGKYIGLLSSNDICKMENRNPIEPEDGGDDYWRPANYVVNGEEPDPALLPGAPGGQQDNADQQDDTSDGSGNSSSASPVRRFLRSVRVKSIPPVSTKGLR